MSSWGLEYYPLCGFDCGQVFNKRHVRKHGFGKADNFGFKEQGTKDPRTRCWLGLGYLSSRFSPSFPFFCFLCGGRGIFFFCAGGGRLSLFQVHLLIFLGHLFVFIPRAFINPMWTLAYPNFDLGSLSWLRVVGAAATTAICTAFDRGVLGSLRLLTTLFHTEWGTATSKLPSLSAIKMIAVG